MQKNSIQLTMILKDFHKEIDVLKIEQKYLLNKVKKSIELLKLKKNNEILGIK